MKDYSMIMAYVRILTVLNFHNGLFVRFAEQGFPLILKQDFARFRTEAFAQNDSTSMKILNSVQKFPLNFVDSFYTELQSSVYNV